MTQWNVYITKPKGPRLLRSTHHIFGDLVNVLIVVVVVLCLTVLAVLSESSHRGHLPSLRHWPDNIPGGQGAVVLPGGDPGATPGVLATAGERTRHGLPEVSREALREGQGVVATDGSFLDLCVQAYNNCYWQRMRDLD